VPPLVANTSGVAELLARAPRNRYEPESVRSLVAGIEALLIEPVLAQISPVSWKQHGERLSQFLSRVASAPALLRAASA
jgi:hypothetical protein